MGFNEDAEELKRHRFFKKINWNKLKAMACKAPKTPDLNGSDDVGQFSEEFTAKEAVESPAEPLTMKNADKLFQGEAKISLNHNFI